MCVYAWGPLGIRVGLGVKPRYTASPHPNTQDRNPEPYNLNPEPRPAPLNPNLNLQPSIQILSLRTSKLGMSDCVDDGRNDDDDVDHADNDVVVGDEEEKEDP